MISVGSHKFSTQLEYSSPEEQDVHSSKGQVAGGGTSSKTCMLASPKTLYINCRVSRTRYIVRFQCNKQCRGATATECCKKLQPEHMKLFTARRPECPALPCIRRVMLFDIWLFVSFSIGQVYAVAFTLKECLSGSSLAETCRRK